MMLGYSRTEFERSREPLQSLSPPDVAALDEAALEHARRNGGVAPPSVKDFLRSDGTRLPVLVTLAVLSRGDDSWIAYALDLSQQELASEPTAAEAFWQRVGSLLADRTRTHTMLDSAPSLIWAVDTQLRVTSANRAFLRARAAVAGGAEQVLGSSVLDGLGDADVEPWRDRHERALRGEHVRERVPIDALGRRWYFDCRFAPMDDGTGSVVGVTAVATDVTDSVAAEAALADTALRFQELFENVSDLVLLANERLLITAVSPSIRDVLGYEPADAVGRGLTEVFGAAEITPPLDTLAEELSVPGAKGHIVARVTDADGHLRWLDLTMVNLLQDPVVGAMAASVRDITDEREARAKLLAQESLLRIAGRLGRIAGWRLDLPDRRVEFSEEMGPVLGLGGMVPLGLDQSLGFYPEPHRSRVLDAIERCLAEGAPFDLEADLELQPGPLTLRIVGEARRDEQGNIVGIDGAVSDIGPLKAIEAEVRRQADVLDAAMFGITIQELDGTIVYWNRAAADLYGWTPEEAVGRHITELVGETDLEEFERVTRALEQRGAWTGRIWNEHRSGRRFPLNLQVTLIRDEQGRPISRFSVATDISDRVELEESLALSQKLDALGQLTGGIAHDFNNLLTVIVGSAEMLHAEVADEPRLASLSQMLLTASERGAQLTNRLLAFARRQALQPEAVDPAAVVDGMFALLRRSLPEHVEMEVVHAPDVWPVLVDRGQLEAALMNVAVNARDAMERGGLLRITTSNLTLDESEAARHPGAAPGDYVRIAVTDTGEGMPADIADHVFEPFFTTKDVGRGSGLGLSMVYGFVQQSGGHVELQSTPGAGTTILLHLPRTDQEPPERRDPSLVRASPRAIGQEAVLVVEDEPMVREHAVGLLRRLGYQVTEAANGPEALDVLRGDERVDLLFTDVVMPGGMNGVELADEARVLRPGLHVLFTSGYTDDAADGVDFHGQLLHKPYKREVLAQRVREALER